jgi:RNA polymerase sigma-70 factor, ECF subfamily
MWTAANIQDVEIPARPPVDEDGFQELVETQRGEIHAHCYRMLGSLHDADDALQDTLVRAWRALPKFRGQSSLRTWLYRIATNVCLDAIARRPKRVLPIDYGPALGPGAAAPEHPLPDAHWVEPYPDETLGVADGAAAPDARYERREALELAFVAALQHLPPRQRAALIMRDVLGFSAKEAAESLDTTVASVNGGLRRARRAVEERLPEQSQQATLRSLGQRRLRNLVTRFVDAFEQGDVDAILSTLAEDARFSMPPYREWCRGREAIADSWLMPSGPSPRLRYLETRANGQPALGVYLRDPEAGAYLPYCMDVLAVDGRSISEVIAFRSAEGFSRFGLPERIPLEG